ncbi:MAG TPA: Oligoendopeptidase F, plasmid [Hyphomicrobiaceae bacterium MAG_BT-2024]
MYTNAAQKLRVFLSANTTQAITALDLGSIPRWDLTDLFPGPDSLELQNALNQAQVDAEIFEVKYKGKLLEKGYDGTFLVNAIRDYEAASDLLGRISTFAFLNYAGDQQNSAHAKLFGDVQSQLTQIFNKFVFFELELNQIPDQQLTVALQYEELAYFKPWLDDLRKEKAYQLEEKLELLFNEKSLTSAKAWNRLFDDTLSAMRFEVNGETLSLEPTLNLLLESDELKRRAGAEALSRTFQDNIQTFTLITNTLTKDKEISDRWRGFVDVADSRHLANRVEGPVVEALVHAVRESYGKLSHRYYKLKAKWLGKQSIPYWDRNAPLTVNPERFMKWSEAKEIVLNAYADFAPQMADIAKHFFDKNWIDASVRPGKAPGAFSHPATPSVHPYILLNYLGSPRDVMTLAHELGHGVHQVLAAKQGVLLSQTPLTLAETASVFGEMLTFKKLLEDTHNLTARKALIAGKVEDMLNTVVRQVAFYEFERKIHIARREGELTSEGISKFWMSVQAESLGSSIELNPGYEVFWAYIGHFIRAPFYVYAYAFGDCLVNSLYALYEESYPNFVNKYLDLLSIGGAKHHSELLASFGLDATQPEFWYKGLSVISGMIDDLEELDSLINEMN